MDIRSQPSTVDGLVRQSAARYPGRTAVHFEGQRWTYAQLDRAVSRVAIHLLRQGLAHGDRVAAYGGNSDGYLIGFLACARAGLIHVPIGSGLTGDEFTYLLQQSGSTAILIDPQLAHRFDAVRDRVAISRVLQMRGSNGCLLDVARHGSDENMKPQAGHTDIVQLLYTSGTTSRPKGAMVTHYSLMHQYNSAIHGLRFHEYDRPLHAMPLFHAAQMHTFLIPYLAIGAENRIALVPDVNTLLRMVEDHRIDSMFLAPTVWAQLSNHPKLDQRTIETLRKAYYGASIMPAPVIKRLKARLPTLDFFNCLGQSEAGPLTSVLLPECHAKRPGSAGRPVLYLEMRVVDAEGRDVQTGNVGEIVYRSPQLCAGYWDDTDATKKAFRNGWFHSGDLARMDEDGYVYMVDRIKDVINTGGVLVASREVEDVLYTHPAVAEAAVIGVPHPKWIEAVVAVIVKKGEVSEQDLINHVRERVAGFKTPKRVHFADSLPCNGSGKLLKRALRAQFGIGEFR